MIASSCSGIPGRLITGTLRGLLGSLILLLGPSLSAQGAAASTIIDPEGEGTEMAKRLRNTPPEEDSEVEGLLQIIPRSGEPRSVPFCCFITLRGTNWQVVYSVPATNGFAAQTLTILHAPDRTNSYRYPDTNSTAPVSLTQPFAQSDFWVQDLGLDFL